MNYSPAPWSFKISPYTISDKDGRSIATVKFYPAGDLLPGNTALMAAAPEMFEALRGIIDIPEPHIMSEVEFKMRTLAGNAIRKTTQP